MGFVGRYGSHAWLGLPYAKPPVGERRWRAPEPPGPWTGVREALAHGARCPQLANLFAGVADAEPGTLTGAEDCLFLNVYAPHTEADRVPRGDARLPVMVWIHGGGNVIGLSDFYDGGRLAQTGQVVVVTLNYRLGPLGWFRHASLRTDASDAERSGSFATLDLVRALEWVRDNVAGFGGDPGRVTIFGESAGGRKVAALLLSPLAAGLFHRAIVRRWLGVFPSVRDPDLYAATADALFLDVDLGPQGNVIYTDENRAAREELAQKMMSYWSQGSDPVDPASVLAAVDADPRLESQRERCWVYRELARWSMGLAERDYPTTGREGCAEYPADRFPWE